MKNLIILAATAALMISGASCGQGQPKTAAAETVYVVGEDKSAILWIDGTPQTLSDKHSYAANAVFVTDDNIVYVTGRDRYIATLWKIQEGQTTKLAFAENEMLSSMFATQTGEVYVAGHICTEGAEGDHYDAACWKVSGTKITKMPLAPVQGAEEGTSANALFVSSDGNVYVAGNSNCDDPDCAGEVFGILWTNGTGQTLPGKESWANDVYASNNGTVYVVGSAAGSSGKELAVMWKNKVLQYLTDGSEENSKAESVFVTPNGDVYVAGNINSYTDQSAAVIWKNGTMQILAKGRYSISSIYVTRNGDVYVAGNVGGRGYSLEAALWKNGVLQMLTNYGNREWDSRAVSVFVK